MIRGADARKERDSDIKAVAARPHFQSLFSEHRVSYGRHGLHFELSRVEPTPTVHSLYRWLRKRKFGFCRYRRRRPCFTPRRSPCTSFLLLQTRDQRKPTFHHIIDREMVSSPSACMSLMFAVRASALSSAGSEKTACVHGRTVISHSGPRSDFGHLGHYKN